VPDAAAAGWAAGIDRPALAPPGAAGRFPGQLARTAEAAGLVSFERNVALLVGLRGERLVARPSFFQLDRVRKARARGLPLRIIAHEDVLVFRRSGPSPADPGPEHR
jgi:modification methylase